MNRVAINIRLLTEPTFGRQRLLNYEEGVEGTWKIIHPTKKEFSLTAKIWS